MKLIIDSSLQKKIKYLCDNNRNNEFSGILFYKYIKGSLIKENMVFRAIDFYLQDIGNAIYTEFNMNDDLEKYLYDNPHLLEEGVYMGLCHSHHNMSTFFSVTDMDTLYEQGEMMVHFLSLIVNNHNKYNAKITYKRNIETKKRTIITDESFNDIKYTIGHKKYKCTRKTKIKFKSLNVEIEKEDDCTPLDDVAKRYRELLVNKRKQNYN